MKMKISLIVPLFNEEEATPIFYKTVRENSELQKYNVEIVFINDGSNDSTENIINHLAVSDHLVVPISFTRNFGKESALFAGIEYASGDAVIPIDVDLQDPIEVIPELIKKWQKGADVVLAKRIDRSTDYWFKRKTAALFYKLHNKIVRPKMEENVGDFRLLSRRTVENIKLLPERNLFMKGIFSWVGGGVEIIQYKRGKRLAGASKFNGWKLLNFAIEGITSFSTFPIRIWTYFGLGVAFLSFIYGIWMIANKLIWGNPVPGYPSLVVLIMFFGGIQLIGIGVIGEYIGKIYIESKKRPRYIVKDSSMNKDLNKYNS